MSSRRSGSGLLTGFTSLSLCFKTKSRHRCHGSKVHDESQLTSDSAESCSLAEPSMPPMSLTPPEITADSSSQKQLWCIFMESVRLYLANQSRFCLVSDQCRKTLVDLYH